MKRNEMWGGVVPPKDNPTLPFLALAMSPQDAARLPIAEATRRHVKALRRLGR